MGLVLDHVSMAVVSSWEDSKRTFSGTSWVPARERALCIGEADTCDSNEEERWYAHHNDRLKEE